MLLLLVGKGEGSGGNDGGFVLEHSDVDERQFDEEECVVHGVTVFAHDLHVPFEEAQGSREGEIEVECREDVVLHLQ